MPGSLSLPSVVCNEGRFWLFSGECVDADRGGDFCMAGRTLPGSASDGLMANLASIGEIGVESSSLFRSSCECAVSVLIPGRKGGGFRLNPDFKGGGLGFANAAEGSDARSSWMTPFVVGECLESSFLSSACWLSVASTISKSSSLTTAKASAAFAVKAASDGVY